MRGTREKPSQLRAFGSITLEKQRAVVTPEVRARSPRLARIGDDELVIVCEEPIPSGGRQLVSRRIERAFTSWPPTIADPVAHRTEETLSAVDSLMAWPDGSFLVHHAYTWSVASLERPGELASFSAPVYACKAQSRGAYVIDREHDRLRLLHRAALVGEAQVRDCGLLPPGYGYLGVMTERGTLLLVGGHEAGGVAVHVVTDDGAQAGARFVVPERARLELVAREGGGAYLSASTHHTSVLYELDERGELAGEPWQHPAIFEVTLHVAFAPWRSGAGLVVTRGGAGLGLILCDGGEATFSPDTIGGPFVPTDQKGGLVASPDGSVVLLAYTDAELGLALARFTCDPNEAAAAFVPAAEPARGPSSESLEAAPDPAPAPSRFGTHDDLRRFFRALAVDGALAQLSAGPTDVVASGTLSAGTLLLADGQGDHLLAHWDATGLVVLGFDHIGAGSEWELPLDQRNPGQHLVGVPAELAQLAERATDDGERLATEGLWIAAGEQGASGESMWLDVIPRLTGLGEGCTAREALEGMRSRGPRAELVARIASAESYAITAEDAALLLGDLSAGGAQLAPRDVKRTVAALARLGVTWKHALTQARPFAAAFEAARQAASALPEPDLALLRAASTGDLAAAKAALAAGANIEVALKERAMPFYPEGATPLLVAIRSDQREVAEHLLAAGANVEVHIDGGSGPESPLRRAAAQGDAAMVRRLLELGASVKPETGYRGVLESVTCPLEHLRQGTPGEYAEVLRLLLDAGAPLPGDGYCAALVRLAKRSGAVDLVPRLRRLYAEDALPGPARAVDPADAPRVSALLTEAARLVRGDSVAALRLLVEAWALNPEPRLAGAAETLARRTRGPSPGYIVSTRERIDGEATLELLSAALEAPPDPRAAREILGWLWTSDIYSNETWLAKCEDAAAALLVHTRDLRFVESLAQHCELGRPVSHFDVRASLSAALVELQTTKPLPLGEADLEQLAAIEDVLAERKHVAKRPDVHTLYGAVYEHPDDDAPRHALAERLLEAGDPRGEFIALQLARHASGGAPSEREKALLDEHGRRWLGEIDAILGPELAYERGFLVQAATAQRYNEHAAERHPLLASGQGTQIEWCTVKRLSLWRHASVGAPSLLRGSRLRGVRELIDVGAGSLSELASGGPRPLRRLELARARVLGWWNLSARELDAIPDFAPSLESLRMPAEKGGLRWLRRFLERLPALRSLSLAVDASLGELAALGRARGLAEVCWLGAVDLRVDFATRTLEVSFPGRLVPSLVDLADEQARSARKLGLERLVVRTPPRAKSKARPKRAPVLERRSERVDLEPLTECADDLGLAFALEPHRDDCFAPNPTRAE